MNVTTIGIDLAKRRGVHVAVLTGARHRLQVLLPRYTGSGFENIVMCL